jgi:hypothetical protein
MAAADCTLTVGEAGVAQGLQDQLAALDAQDAEAVANEQTAQMLGDTAAQDQLASAQQTALDGYNNGVAQAYVAYQTSDYSDQTAVATTLNSTLSIPWSQFEQQEAGADQNWWSSEQSGYLAWFSQTQSAGDAYQDAVNVQSTTETATQAAADAAQTNQSAQAGLTQTLAQSAAADAQTQALALAQQSYLDATALVDRNQAVATAQGSSGSFSSQLAAAGQQYVTQATAAGDAYNTAAAAGDLAYATATSQIDDAYATATDSAQDTSTDAQTADSGTLQTALADDQAGYDENQQTTYASALSGLETSDPSPWAQLSAAQASAEETATDTIDSAQATGTIAQVTAADTQTDAQAGADATQDIAGVTAQGQQAIADANAEVAQAAADTAADAGATGFASAGAGATGSASAAGQLPAQYVDWVFGSPAAPSTPAAYASPQPDAEYATIVNREEGTPYSAFSPGFPNAGDWAPGGQWAWYGSLAQYLGVTAAPTYQSPMARPALQQHTIRTYPAAETPGGGLSQFSSGENGTVPFSPPATAASAASSLSQTVSQTDPGLTRSPAASVALPANLVSTVDSTAMQGVAAIQFSQFSAIAPWPPRSFPPPPRPTRPGPRPPPVQPPPPPVSATPSNPWPPAPPP